MANFYNIDIQAGQDLYDIAIQEYGSPQAVFILMEDNPAIITDLDVDLNENMQLKIREATALNLTPEEEEMVDKEVMTFARKKQLKANNASTQDV